MCTNFTSNRLRHFPLQQSELTAKQVVSFLVLFFGFCFCSMNPVGDSPSFVRLKAPFRFVGVSSSWGPDSPENPPLMSPEMTWTGHPRRGHQGAKSSLGATAALQSHGGSGNSVCSRSLGKNFTTKRAVQEYTVDIQKANKSPTVLFG